MRICFYTNTALPRVGGQELVIDALARRLTVLGNEVVLLAPWRRCRRRFVAESSPYPVAWHPRFCSTRRFVSWYGRWLAKLHRRHRFELLHCHDTYPTAYVAASCAALAGVPLVITSHGGDLDPTSLLLRKPQLADRYLLALRRADAAIAVSTFTERRFREVYPRLHRIERIPNGVDVAQLSAVAARPAGLDPAVRPGRYVLFLGRLVPRKGVDLLLMAFAMAVGDSQAVLVIAGEGPQRPSLETQVARSGLGDRVRFVGHVEGERKTYLLQNAVCTVVPSRISEAFGLVVLESYAAGRPVIGTRLPGLADLIDQGRTGLLVAPDSPGALAEAVRRAIRHRALMDRFGDQARTVVRNYDWDRVAHRHLALYEELVGRANARKTA